MKPLSQANERLEYRMKRVGQRKKREKIGNAELKIPGNGKKLSESRASGAAHHSRRPVTSLLSLRHRYREWRTAQWRMDTSQKVFPGLILAPVCRTGCVDDLHLEKGSNRQTNKQKKHQLIIFFFVSNTWLICWQEITALSFINAKLFCCTLSYRLLLLGHMEAPYSLFSLQYTFHCSSTN